MDKVKYMQVAWKELFPWSGNYFIKVYDNIAETIEKSTQENTTEVKDE